VHFELFPHVAPRAVENFRVLCAGERADYRLSYKGVRFHRVVAGKLLQSGDTTKHTGQGGASIYGSPIADEDLSSRHFPFALCTAGTGGASTSQFYIVSADATAADCARLDGQDVVFGRVVAGFEVVRAVDRAAGSEDGAPRVAYVVSACGMCYGRFGPLPPMPEMPVVAAAAAPTPPTTASAAAANDDDKSSSAFPRQSSGSLASRVVHPPIVRMFSDGALVPEAMANMMQELLRLIECPVCLSNFDSYSRVPATLPCGHSVCLSHVPLLQASWRATTTSACATSRGCALRRGQPLAAAHVAALDGARGVRQAAGRVRVERAARRVRGVLRRQGLQDLTSE
jgi:peptidylprolyl isomerase